MWFLKKLNGTSYPLYTKSEHIIGRFGSLDLELSDDASISRKHASIVITLKDGRPKFTLRDLGSKYGTFINDGIESISALPKTMPVELKIGDRIKFGLQTNTWILEESKFRTGTSTLSSGDKKNLRGILNRLEGEIVADWDINCTHLTMTQIKTTIKSVYAAAQVKPIVSLDYWERLEEIFFGSVETPLPDCDDFVPLINESQIKSSLISMKMNKNRKTIFASFRFIFFNAAQMENIKPIVEVTGGTVVDGNSYSFKINECELCEDKVVVVENCNNEANARYTRVTNILNSKSLRLIREVEIYLSIFECSTKRHCNPKYDASVLLCPSDSEILVKEEASVLADATQNLQSVQETQFLETASGNFALEVVDIVASNESDDDDIIPDTDPSIICGTPADSQPIKRKLPESEGAVKRKSARLDSWLLKKPSVETDGSSASESVLPSSLNTNRKGFKDLFSFRGPKPETNKAFGNLFNSNDSSPQSVSVPKNKEIVSSRTGSLFNTTTNKPSEAGDQKANRTAGLFGNVSGVRSTRSSSSLIADSQEPSTSKNPPSGKRKREVEVSSKAKSHFRATNLFEKRAKRPSVVLEVLIDSDSNDDLEPISKKTSTLTLVDDAPGYQDSPVDVPSKMSLTQFQNAPPKENVTHVKTEVVSPMKETLDKSVIHTMPLVQNDIPNIQHRSVNTSIVNFKKFRKNQVNHPTSSTSTVMRLTLFSDGKENGFDDD